MDSSSVCDENSEMDYPPSSEDQIERSNTDTGCSTPGGHSIDYTRTTSEVSSYSEPSILDEPLALPLGLPLSKLVGRVSPVITKLRMKQHADVLDEHLGNDDVANSELEMMKEKFSKLLLGEDMSGSGKGVCSAVAISNAITNLYCLSIQMPSTVFGHCYKLEPLPPEKKSMWRRDMACLLSVCDCIVEFFPSFQNLPDGSTLEVMARRPRSDIHINLPALEKLDAILLEILDSFQNTDFWYVDDGMQSSIACTSRSFRQVIHRNDEKWWLPVPYVPVSGLPERSRKELQQKRECANQIHKAAMAINSAILAEMEVPESYLAALPKSGRASIGDSIYRHMSTPKKFCPDNLLDGLDIASEHEALEFADRAEAAICVWQRKASMSNSKSSWDMVKDLIADGDKNYMLANRAESLLLCLKHRYPVLSQTTLDTSKIQYNKDVGQASLESYSRVLESLAFNIIAWIDDVLSVDGFVKRR